MEIKEFFSKAILNLIISSITFILVSYIIKGFDFEWSILVFINLVSFLTLVIIYKLRRT